MDNYLSANITCCIIGELFEYEPMGWNEYDRYYKIAKKMMELEIKTCIAFECTNFVSAFSADSHIEMGKFILSHKGVNISAITPLENYNELLPKEIGARRINFLKNPKVSEKVLTKNELAMGLTNYLFSISNFAIILCNEKNKFDLNTYIEKAKKANIKYVVVSPYTYIDDGFLKLK